MSIRDPKGIYKIGASVIRIGCCKRSIRATIRDLKGYENIGALNIRIGCCKGLTRRD